MWRYLQKSINIFKNFLKNRTAFFCATLSWKGQTKRDVMKFFLGITNVWVTKKQHSVKHVFFLHLWKMRQSLGIAMTDGHRALASIFMMYFISEGENHSAPIRQWTPVKPWSCPLGRCHRLSFPSYAIFEEAPGVSTACPFDIHLKSKCLQKCSLLYFRLC